MLTEFGAGRYVASRLARGLLGPSHRVIDRDEDGVAEDVQRVFEASEGERLKCFSAAERWLCAALATWTGRIACDGLGICGVVFDHNRHLIDSCARPVPLLSPGLLD